MGDFKFFSFLVIFMLTNLPTGVIISLLLAGVLELADRLD